MMEISVKEEKELDKVAEQILNAFDGHAVFSLEGDMGAGKTTLVKAFCRALGVTDAVNSPTYALINEYCDRAGQPVFHFDLYRLKNAAEAMDAGVEEYLYSGCRCFVEWPAIIAGLLPEGTVNVRITVNSDGSRTVTAEKTN